AYRGGLDIYDERTGEYHLYGKRTGNLDHTILTPPRVPEEMKTAQGLWNAVELFEKRKDAQVSRENVVALHDKLTLEQNRELLHGFVNEAYVKRGMIAQTDIHAPGKDGDQRNIHAHILLTMRSVNRNGLNEKKARNWNEKETLLEWRKLWAQHMNHALERAGIEERVSEKSFKDLGLDQIPSRHLGVAANEMERRGEQTRIGDENREAEKRNRELAALKLQEQKISAAIEAEKQILKAEQERQHHQERKNWAQNLKMQAEQRRQERSFAEELDKTRAAEATREKEQARIEEIFGQQEKNIEEGRRLGRVPLDDYERPAPEIAPQEPQYDSAREMLDHYEKAATGNDNAKEPDKGIEQEKGRDYGGYER
ncbi:MAG: MobA/MobL family protein, partial [bacterium]